MPDEDRIARINQAVDAILEHCTQHGAGSLLQCIGGLKRNPIWAPEEIEVVRRVVQSRLREAEK